MKGVKEFEQFKANYESGSVSISANVSYNLKTVIEKNDQIRNAKFEDDTYPDGDDKLFYNISRIITSTVYKETDVDLKDLKVHPYNQITMKLAPLLRPVIHAYLKLENFSEDINRFRQELIEMGHLITKEVDGETHDVNLLNVIRPPHVMDLQDGGLIESCKYTWEDILKYKKDWDNWEDIEAIKEELDKEQEQYFRVYEWWTVDKFGKKETKGCIKFLDREIIRPIDSSITWQPFVEVDRFETPESMKIRDKKKLKRLQEQGYIEKGKDEMPIYPYEEQRCFTIPGRWMGLGFIEITIAMQRHYNDSANSERRFNQLAHRGVIVHKQSATGEQRTLTQEFLSNLDTGAILSIENDEDLQRLNIGSHTGEFIASADKIFELARQVTGLTAQGTGEEVPASTTATIGIINQQSGKSTYDIIIEQQDLFLRRLFEKFKLKSIIKDVTAQEWVEICGDARDLLEMESIYIDQYVNERIVEKIADGTAQRDVFMIMDTMEVGLDEAQDILVKTLTDSLKQETDKMGEMRFAQIKKEILKSVDFGLEFYVTNESFDVATRAKAINEALMRDNLTLSREKLEEEWADLVGLSGRGLRKTDEEKEREMMQTPEGTTEKTPAREGAMAATQAQANRMA